MRMATEVENFVSKFHNLDGISINAKKKSLFLLLNNIPSAHDELIASIIPKNHLEILFKLEFLLKLQRISELLQVLKSEKEFLVAKLLKNKWFCRRLAAILDENSTDFVNGVLPFMSFVTRERLINKLGIYGTKLDSVFDEICSRYGIYTASNMLLGCTETKIGNVLRNNSVLLPRHHVKLLFEKFPQAFDLYTKQEHQQSHDDIHIAGFALINDLQYIESFLKIHAIRLKFGKRSTRKLLTNFKDFAIANANTLICCLHHRTVIKVLRDDFKQFYFNCFPSTIDSLPYVSSSFYEVNQKLGKQHYHLLLEGVDIMYNKSLYDFPDLVSWEMMEAMDVNERQKWVEIKKNKGASDNDLIKFMRIPESIPTIKSKINVTSSINNREDLLKALVTTCKINNDLDALAEVGEYVRFRHRNDDCAILIGFLCEIKNCFKLQKLEERHWEFINAIMNIANLNEYQLHCKYDFLADYIAFSFNKNRLSEKQILDFLKLIKRIERWDYKIDNAELGKLLLLKSINFMPELMEKYDKLEEYDLRLINLIIQWNKRHLKMQLSIHHYPRLLQSLLKSIDYAINIDEFNVGICGLGPIFEFIVCTKDKSDFRDEMIKFFFAVGFRYYNIKVDLWLLKWQPEIIASNFDKFLEHVTDRYQPDIKILDYINKYSDLSFKERTISYCLERISRNDENNNYKLFVILAVLMPAKDYLQYILPHYPSTDKMNDNADDISKEREFPVAIAKSFKYTKNSIVLPTLIGYCKGDFLRYSLESLYYLFYHFPENKLSTFINDLSSKAVSVRKHSIFLTCIVGSVSDVQKLLRRFIENERNVSVQKHMFTAVFKYFIRNPSNEFWESLKICMMNLDKNDSESFKMLVNVRQIPAKYKASHVVFVWNILKKNESSGANRSVFLSSIPSQIYKDLPLEFLLEVIVDNFLKDDEHAITQFTITSLTETAHSIEILDAIFEIITKLKSANLTKEKNVFGFVEYFVSTVEIDCHEALFRLFSERWQNVFSPMEAIEEHLKISFTILYYESVKDLLEFNNRVVAFLNILLSTYNGIVIVDIFALVLKEYLQLFLKCFNSYSEDFFKFCSLLLNRGELVCQFLVIKLIPTKSPGQLKAGKLFCEIIERLKQIPDNSVQMALNLHIKRIE